ncbi:MAG: hypothetical protein ACO3RV_00945 [Luteolibacter sp.]
MVFLIIFSIFSLFRQYDEIEKFTSAEPKQIDISNFEDQEIQLNTLSRRLEKFRQDLVQGNPCTLELDANDINLAIAAFESLKDLRGKLHVQEIDSQNLSLEISFPLNGKPRMAKPGESGWIASDPRYLNATLICRPALLSYEPVLKIDTIDVPGAVVPAEFIDHMSPYRIAEVYRENPTIGPAMKKLSRVEIRDQKLILMGNTGDPPADQISDQEVNRMSGRFFTVLGIAASIFLLFIGTVIIIGLRAKRR